MQQVEGSVLEVDVAVVGAGFSGLYLLKRLREAGLSVRVFDAAGDVGGTWFWNRYPGARCDVPSTDYTYSFDPELEQAWSWSEKYATQPEILAYLRFVADRYDLRRDITLGSRVEAAVWDEASERWTLSTSGGQDVVCRYYVMASGCLSVPKSPDISGSDRFVGDSYWTSSWPHEGVDVTGKRVAVIGTGSSGIQTIPHLAAQAAQLTVFQRTPNFSLPARNGPLPAERVAKLASDRPAYREAARWSLGGVHTEPNQVFGVYASEEVRRQRFEDAWAAGELFAILDVFGDQAVNPASNEIVSEMVREKIRGIVRDPATAELLCPHDHPLGSKRCCLDTGYYDTFNQPHVRLVDLRSTPITTVTEIGIDTTAESMGFDVIVYATGFDAMTGALVSVDITGRNGVTLKEKWADGPSTYLGLTAVGFPNFFALTGPGSPSVLSNMAVSIEQHVDWVTDCLIRLRADGFQTIEPTPLAEDGWDQHVADGAAITLHQTANSWYMGANVAGKKRVLYPYVAGVDQYRWACDQVAAQDYLGFRRSGPTGEHTNDGVVCQLQPDVKRVLDVVAGMQLPALETMSAPDARAFMDAMNAARPPGPEVAEIVDGVLLGPAGDLPYRLYRPAGAGPHPVVAYFHGGGWVLGSKQSDEPFCRDLCARSGAVVVSVDYRHAPQDRFPAAADDAFAAVSWIADNAILLGGIPGELVVAGWSAGGNVATVACHRARDEGHPQIRGQLLLTPATDSDPNRPSYTDNGDRYVLTAPLMRWFWEHYCDEAQRQDPRAAPLHGDLAGLPPAIVITAQFDPLRDEGIAYVEALQAAGVPVQHVSARGHNHSSLTMVDVVISGAQVREEIAQRLRTLFPSTATVAAVQAAGTEPAPV